MENVKYTTEKSRPNLFREISGGLKASITLLLVLFVCSSTFGQTTETRYYNGKHTKETALQKANDFFKRTNGERITFTKMEKKSDYQFVGNWIIKGADESLQSKIEYLFEDDGLKIKINEIVLNDTYGTLKMDKNHKDEVVRKTAENLYTAVNDLFVKAVFVFLDINNNTTSTQPTTTAGANTNSSDPYRGLSTEAGAYMAAYRMMPKGLKKYLGNQHKSWENKGYSAEKISQSYADMFKEVYTKDKKAAFELIIHMPDSWLQADKLKSVFSLLTKEQQLYIQDEANRR